MQFLFRFIINPNSIIPSKVDIPMERVAALVEKLTTQLAEKADKSQLKQTAVQLLAALSETDHFNNLPNNVSVMMPGNTEVASIPIPEVQPIEVRIPNLPTLETVELIDSISNTSEKEATKIDTNEINATIKYTELQEKLALDPIKDLKGAIGTNDKFQFIATLFDGDEIAFEKAIKTINGFKIYAEAQFWIKCNLRAQHHWDEKSDVVNAFDLLVKRRFA